MARSSAEAGIGSILIVGTSFKTATLTLREGISKALSDVSMAPHSLAAVRESTTLQTCNRLELYLVSSRPRSPRDLFSVLPPGLRERRRLLRLDRYGRHLASLRARLGPRFYGPRRGADPLSDKGCRREGETRGPIQGHPLHALRRSGRGGEAGQVGVILITTTLCPRREQVGQRLCVEVCAREAREEAETLSS